MSDTAAEPLQKKVPSTPEELEAILTEKHYPHMLRMYQDHGLIMVYVVHIEGSNIATVFSPYEPEATLESLRDAVDCLVEGEPYMVVVGADDGEKSP